MVKSTASLRQWRGWCLLEGFLGVVTEPLHVKLPSPVLGATGRKNSAVSLSIGRLCSEAQRKLLCLGSHPNKV